MATKKASSSRKQSTVKATTSKATFSAYTKSVVKFGKALKGMPLLGVIVAEFIGTFLLVAATMSLTVTYGQLPVGLVVGLVLVAIVLLVGGVSGAHLNPAATIGAYVTRKISAIYALGYIFAQALGATAAVKLLSTYLEATKNADTQSSLLLVKASTIADGKEWLVLFAELIGVTILTFGIATALRHKNNRAVAAITQGFSILAALTIAGSLTILLSSAQQGTTLAFLNPVIAFAANAIPWPMTIWPIAIYIVAPVIGGIIGFALQDYLHTQSDSCDCETCN